MSIEPRVLRYADVCRKAMIVHKADTEINRLARFKGLNSDHISESDGIFAAIFTVNNADSSLRIEGLYDALHMTPLRQPMVLLYCISRDTGVSDCIPSAVEVEYPGERFVPCGAHEPSKL
jgi:hypothetical protein